MAQLLRCFRISGGLRCLGSLRELKEVVGSLMEFQGFGSFCILGIGVARERVSCTPPEGSPKLGIGKVPVFKGPFPQFPSALFYLGLPRATCKGNLSSCQRLPVYCIAANPKP